jgi:hypothetical protein
MANRMPSGSVGITYKRLTCLARLSWRRSLPTLQALLFDQRGSAMPRGYGLAIGTGNPV